MEKCKTAMGVRERRERGEREAREKEMERKMPSHWIMQIANVIGVISNVNIKTYVIDSIRVKPVAEAFIFIQHK